jgi:hypothetical protein
MSPDRSDHTRDASSLPSVGAIVRAAPGAARFAADAWWRTGRWTLETSWRTGTRLGRAVITGESPGEVLSEVGDEAREYLRRALGIVDIVATSATNVAMPEAPNRPDPNEDPTAELRRRGAELLRRSADVDYEEDAHPAYERILGSLAPDEARILRLLCARGPQPSVDVRGAKGIKFQLELIAPGLQMIGQEAGVRYLDRVPAYLNNLYRLGLIWFSRESLSDPRDYAVLEAQPEVHEALAEATRSKTIRRSIHLTPFGEDFCAVCLPEPVEEADSGSRDGRGNGSSSSGGGERRRREHVAELEEKDETARETEEMNRAQQTERERDIDRARRQES